MKHWLVLIGLILLSLPQGVVTQDIINLGATEFPPYLGKNLKHGGIMTKIAQEAYERVGYQVNIHYYPWTRLLYMVKVGDLDGVVQVWMQEERKEWLLFSDPIPLASEIVLYKHKDMNIEFDGQDYLALKPYTIGIGQDYANPKEFEKVRKHLKVDSVTEDIQNLQKLKLGRIDLVIIDKLVAQYLLKKKMSESMDTFDWLNTAISVTPNYVGISKKTPQAQKKLKDFNRGLALLKQEGRIQAILVELGFKE